MSKWYDMLSTLGQSMSNARAADLLTRASQGCSCVPIVPFSIGSTLGVAAHDDLIHTFGQTFGRTFGQTFDQTLGQTSGESVSTFSFAGVARNKLTERAGHRGAGVFRFQLKPFLPRHVLEPKCCESLVCRAFLAPAAPENRMDL